jgi:hypothetical protein
MRNESAGDCCENDVVGTQNREAVANFSSGKLDSLS